MRLVLASSFSNAFLGGLATWAFLTQGDFLVWAAVIAWGCFFHTGGAPRSVVTTVAGEVRRTVKTGSNGWISESRTADELADGLRWSLAQPRDVVSVAAVEAVRPFQAATVLQQLYDAYRELAATQIAPSG